MQSNKADAIRLGIQRLTTRSYHNIIIWEYQVQQRPTGMMLEGMNFWMQKMRKRYYILSIASTLVRKKDPYYMKELEKCRSDNEISYWMKYSNPNYIHTFKAPHMKPKFRKIFQDHYWEQKEKQSKAETARKTMTLDYTRMIEDVWTQINVKHTLSLIELGEDLANKGFRENDRKAFMRDYGRYNRARMWEGSRTKNEEEMGAQKDGAI
jgi:hypothetical protein